MEARQKMLEFLVASRRWGLWQIIDKAAKFLRHNVESGEGSLGLVIASHGWSITAAF